MKRAFTLIELLVTMAIIAVLSAILFPAFVAAKEAIQTWAAGESMRNLGSAFAMYSADSDDTAPLAMYTSEDGYLTTWFGQQTGPGQFDPKGGLLAPYMKGHPKDITFTAKPWMGDDSGFGYNWGYIGSDFNLQPAYVDFPNCRNAATASELTDPSGTVVFTTSSFFNAPWLASGDSQAYQFNFIDPPRLWNGNPNVDFRHQGQKKVDKTAKTVTSTGRALVLRADGSLKAMQQTVMTDKMFER
jgi:prepilin-type N-terminal cleavage/methylation domain-containing protein